MKLWFHLLLCFPLIAFGQQAQRPSLNPIIFVHGFLASGDTWAHQLIRFKQKGYYTNQLYVLDWNTTGDRKVAESKLLLLIQHALQQTGASKVDLVGHSAGGSLCYSVLKDSLIAAKVGHYVHVGSNKIKSPAGNALQIPTLNIYSDDDKVLGGSDVIGATNIHLVGLDHLEVATADTSFKAMFTFFSPIELPTTVITLTKPMNFVTIGGRLVYMADNNPVQSAKIEVFLYDAKKGKRKSTKALATVYPDSSGNWELYKISTANFIEFVVTAPDNRKITYYHEPFTTNDATVYLRCLPQTGMAAKLLGALPTDDQQSVLAIFTATKAVIHGRDSLTVNGLNLSSAVLAPASKTLIASFLFDDGDGITSGNAIKQFGAGVFLQAVDFFCKPVNNQFYDIYFNGKRMKIPAQPSKENISVVVFNN
ncbi:MAG: alpha/beta fold hydrolase [Ferruginibacter sp.]